MPIARLFDSDRYTGSNPEVTAEPRIGIAETANAHLVSEDTGAGQYPHPAISNMDKYVGTYSKLGQKRAYYKMKPAFHGLLVNPVAAECALNELTGFETLCVDDDVWRETARHMLPRAVGYSAALLDYFFRGKLEVSRESDPETGLPRLRIVNRSPEPLGERGEFTLYRDDQDGNRTPVPGASLTLAAAVPKDNDVPLYLPIPADLPEAGLTLVYRGPLGLEQDAVIGKVLTEVVVEEVYQNWTTNKWILRTKDGLYVLPLETVAGLTAPINRLTWGDRNNQLVAVTDPTGPDSYEALLFELERPLGSAAVPLTGELTEDGYPLVALRLLQRVPLYEVLGALDLHTTVAYTNQLEFTQYAVTYALTTTCTDTDPAPSRDAYTCTDTMGADALRPVTTWSEPVTAEFPLALQPDRHRAIQEDPPYYGWDLWEIRADRAGHLVATVAIETTHLPPGGAMRRVPLREFDPAGALVESPYSAILWLNEPPAWVAAVVDLTEPRLLAKSATDAIRFQLHSPQMDFALYGAEPYFLVGIWHETLYAGGSREGERHATWENNWRSKWGDLPPGTPTREGLTLTAPSGQYSVEGFLRPSLATLGLSEVEVVAGSEGSSSVPYRSDPDGTAVLLRVQPASQNARGPGEWLNWTRWVGPAPGRLALQASTGDAQRTWFVDWHLETDTATLAYTETTAYPVYAVYTVTANASGALTVRWSDDGGLWVPWAGGAPLALPEAIYTNAWDYVALDPDHLYNKGTGHFHTLAPGLPAETGPPALVPTRDRGWWWGEYHVVGR